MLRWAAALPACLCWNRCDRAHAAGRTLGTVKGCLALEGVHFAYPQRAGTPVFAGLSLDVQPGASLALVGTSGSGKCARPPARCARSVCTCPRPPLLLLPPDQHGPKPNRPQRFARRAGRP
jgi:hypothetical protein